MEVKFYQKVLSPKYVGDDLPVKTGDTIVIKKEFHQQLIMRIGEFRRDLGGFSCNKLGGPSIPADCPKPEIEGVLFEKLGQSGISARNHWVAQLPNEKVDAWVVERKKPLDHLYELCDKDRIETPSLKQTTEVRILMNDWRNKYFLHISKESIEKKMGDWDAVVISEFNKSPFFNIIPEEFSGFMVKRTTRDNITVCIIRRKHTILVPPEIKGLVIGCRGSRINALSKEVGFHIKVK